MPAENRRLVWAPAATNDLRDIWRYFVGVASPEVADRLLRDIQRASERVRQRPLAWRARDEVMPGLRSVWCIRTSFSIDRRLRRSRSCAWCISGEISPRYFRRWIHSGDRGPKQ